MVMVVRFRGDGCVTYIFVRHLNPANRASSAYGLDMLALLALEQGRCGFRGVRHDGPINIPWATLQQAVLREKREWGDRVSGPSLEGPSCLFCTWYASALGERTRRAAPVTGSWAEQLWI